MYPNKMHSIPFFKFKSKNISTNDKTDKGQNNNEKGEQKTVEKKEENKVVPQIENNGNTEMKEEDQNVNQVNFVQTFLN